MAVIPAALHYEADRLAMEKGMSVISEKPLAMNLNEAVKLFELKKAPCKTEVYGFAELPLETTQQNNKKAINDGLIGNIESILLEFRQQEDLQGYRKDLAKPLLEDMAIHHFDLIRFLQMPTVMKFTAIHGALHGPNIPVNLIWKP